MPTLTTLVSFNGLSGQMPFAGLMADAAGNLYGTTIQGGASGDGTVFELSGVFRLRRRSSPASRVSRRRVR